MVRNAGSRAEFRGLVGDIRLRIDVVRMAVNVRVIRNARACMQDDFGAIVEQNIFMNGAAIFDGEVVAVGEFDVVKDFDAFAKMFKNMPPQHAAKTESQPMIETQR